MTKESLPFTVSLDLALGGKGAVARDKFEAALNSAGEALRWLRQRHDDRSLELLTIPARTDDIDRAREVAKSLEENTSEIAVLVSGGSSLGGQALLALRS